MTKDEKATMRMQRRAYAWMLRQRGLTLKQIGAIVGKADGSGGSVTAEVARTLVGSYARVLERRQQVARLMLPLGGRGRYDAKTPAWLRRLNDAGALGGTLRIPTEPDR